MAGATIAGVDAALARLGKLAQGVAGAKSKPVYVGTTLFYGAFQERGTRRGVTGRHFLERAARAARGALTPGAKAKITDGDVLGGLVELARRVRSVAASGAPRERGILGRSIKIQVGGRARVGR